jgi:hypothetical protein
VGDGWWNRPDEPVGGTNPDGGAADRAPAPRDGEAGGYAGATPRFSQASRTDADWSDSLRAGAAEPGRPSSDTPICQFLRSINADGSLGDPQSVAVSNHRCAAFGDPLPLSLRQQELVCLQRVHVSCPRYLRGTVLANEAALAAPQEEEHRRPGIIALAALALVVVAIAILVTGPVLGILPFGGASATPSPIIVVVSPTPGDTATATATVAVTATPTAAATRTAGATATTAPTATPLASPTWPPGATASRMNLLTPCPNGQNCYIYIVRGPGQNGSQVTDTLQGIANFFGVKVDAIVALNPGLTKTSVLTAGQELKIPPPTR